MEKSMEDWRAFGFGTERDEMLTVIVGNTMLIERKYQQQI